MSAVCREGHVSDEADYCSVCGTPILPRPAPPAGSLAAKVGGTPIPLPRSALIKDPLPGACPSCGEPREDPNGRFCEVCRFDFVENRPGPPPVARAPQEVGSAPKPPAAAAPAGPPSTRGATSTPVHAAVRVPASGWEIVLAVDPSLDTEPDLEHPCPVDRPEIVMPVDKPDMLMGRHDETRAIHPEIPLHDPGASRRHAKFVLDGDGGISLQDLASTNGTQVNGQDVSAGTKRRLRDGDRVTLGRWTRITVRGRR